jgi:hypothetical protein
MQTRFIHCQEQMFQDSWIGRGLLEVFAGSLLLTCAMAHKPTNSEASLPLASFYTATTLGIIGVLHVVLGVLCIRQLRDWSLNELKKRKQKALQAKQLFKNKSEIEELIKKAEEGEFE